MRGFLKRGKGLPILGCLFALVIVVVGTGCPVPDPRVSNQGGGNIITATTKVASNQLTELTPDEIQIVGDTITTFIPDAPAVSLTDDQAAAVADVLDANSINSIEDAIALASNPQDVVLPDEFIELFGEFDTSALDSAVDEGS